MALYKKMIIGAVIIITVLLSANFAINLWIDSRLPEIISDKNKSPYHITYKDLTIDLWRGNFKANNVVIIPKIEKDPARKMGLYANIDFIEIERVNILDLLFKDRIFAERITFIKPEILLYKKNAEAIKDAGSIRSEIVQPFNKIISVSNIYLDQGNVRIINVNNNKPLLIAENINLQLEGMLITKDIMKNKIPFVFKKYGFICDSFYYKLNEFYHLEAQNIIKHKNEINIIKFSLVPEFGRKEFVKRLKKEQDLYNIAANSIKIRNLNWGFKQDQLFINAGAMITEQVSANIFRSKIPPDNLKKKLLYNSLLRKVSFPLKLDTLIIRNSKLSYEEGFEDTNASGILTFSKFNLTAKDIRSGFGQNKIPDVKIDVNCRFMDSSPLRVKWSFNVFDANDGFKIKGSIINFDTEKISPFFKAYVNMTAGGVFDEVKFDIKGNNFVSTAECIVKYHDFKLTVYKKEKPGMKSKLKTTIANLLIKNDSDGRYKNTKVKVQRFQEKSFYNFLWRTIVDGIKQILI